MSQQIHSGKGDNVAGNKVINNNYKVKVGALIAVIILATAAVILSPMFMPENVPLQGHVVSSGGIPIKGAKVVFKGSENREFNTLTNDDGFFIFENINTKDEDDFSLKASFEKRTSQLDTLGSKNGLSQLQLVLSQGIPPFDVSYYNLKSEAITWLVNGGRSGAEDKTWKKTFNGLPYVINNEILQELKIIFNQYQEPWRPEHKSNEFDIPFTTYFADENSSESLIWKPLIHSENWYYKGKKLHTDTMKRIVQNAPPISNYMEHINYYLKPNNNFENAYISPQPSDLSNLYKKGNNIKSKLKFFSYIGRENIPDDFLKITISSMFPDGCIENNSTLSHPKMSVQVAVIENNSGKSIEIDSFYLQTFESSTIRTLVEDDSTLATLKTNALKLYPKHRLLDQKKIMIPLRIVFQSDNQDYYNQNVRKETWVYGSSHKIKKINVGIERFAFRQKDPNSLLIYNGEGIGSCPYAYTFNYNMDKWQLEDHFIFNQNSVDKNQRDTISLSQFDGRLQIRELDPETSHIDLVEVHHISENGKITRYTSDHPKLKEIDDNFFIMNQGDSITLTFNEFKKTIGGNYFLVSKGYYELYQ